MSSASENYLTVNRYVRFGEVDAAGVICFQHLFRWCHESWEESLHKYGINFSDVFPVSLRSKSNPEIALPIVHCNANFLLPIQAGDYLNIHLAPQKINPRAFEIKARVQKKDKDHAVALIRHLAIDTSTRKPCELPPIVNKWLEDCSDYNS